MRRTTTMVACLALTLAACTTTKPKGPVSSQPFCLPCTVPCTPEQCEPKKVAAKPVPPPPPPPVASEAATFNPAPGTYIGPQSVELSTTTPGAAIHYTTDGSVPTAESPLYTGPIAVGSTTSIQAITTKPGAPDSPVAAGTYTIQPPPPPPPPPRVAVTKERIELNEKIHFATGKSAIDPSSYSLLDETAEAIKSHPDIKRVVIEGHTDNRGGAKANMKLSQGRAQAVRSYLVKKGVEPARLQAKGFGATKPIASNATEAGRESNRRVEFVIP